MPLPTSEHHRLNALIDDLESEGGLANYAAKDALDTLARNWRDDGALHLDDIDDTIAALKAFKARVAVSIPKA